MIFKAVKAISSSFPRRLKKNMTIILSSHKFSVLQFCDQLYKVNNGKIEIKS